MRKRYVKNNITNGIKIFGFASKRSIASKSGNLRALSETRRAEEKISLISGSTAEDVQTPIGAHNNSGLIFPSCCLD